MREFAREQEQLRRNLSRPRRPGRGREWFESAVDCAAFLAWRVAGRGARVRFRTQEFDLVTPEEGDIHRILKYLALVRPLAGKEPEPSDDQISFQVVLTTRPARMAELGWVTARMLTPETMGPAPSMARFRDLIKPTFVAFWPRLTSVSDSVNPLATGT